MGVYRWSAPAGTDPVNDGGSVGALVLRELVGDTFTTAATVAGPAVKVEDGLYEWVLPAALPESRYWPQVAYDTDGSTPVTANLPEVDLPDWETTGRVVSPWPVAIDLGVDLPLSDLHRARIGEAIVRAQGKVEDRLNRPLLPTTAVFTNRTPLTGYELTSPRAWPDIVREADDRVTVVSAVLDGFTYTVTCLVGLNAATDPALAGIRDFVVADAAAQLRSTPTALGGRLVQSVSADGQSVSYVQAGGGPDGSGAAGSTPTLAALEKKWKRRSAFQRDRGKVAAWPYRGF